MHALAPAFKELSTSNEIDHDSDDDEFLGFTSQEVQEAEKKLQNVLHRERLLDMLATDWADLEVECPTAHNLTYEELAHQAVGHEVEEPREEDTRQDAPPQSAGNVVDNLRSTITVFLPRTTINWKFRASYATS